MTPPLPDGPYKCYKKIRKSEACRALNSVKKERIFNPERTGEPNQFRQRHLKPGNTLRSYPIPDARKAIKAPHFVLKVHRTCISTVFPTQGRFRTVREIIPTVHALFF